MIRLLFLIALVLASAACRVEVRNTNQVWACEQLPNGAGEACYDTGARISY